MPTRSLVSMPRTSLVVPAIAAAGGLAFFAWKPGVALSTIASPRAFGFAAAVGILTLALGWALPRIGRGFALTALAQSVPVVVAFAIAVLPSFRTVTVNDPLPTVAGSETGGAPPVPAARTTVAQAPFRGIKHRASGTSVLIRLSDGSRVVRLQTLDVEPGPDYSLFVVPGAERQRPDGGTRLGHLRGSRGNQNYPVLADVDLSRPATVLIWCRAFDVPVAAATLH